MLKAMRRSVQSAFVKIFLFGILIISFGLWGVTDLFVGNPQQQVVASVADKELDFATFNAQLQQTINNSGMDHSNITPELARFFEQSVLNNWAIETIVQQEVADMRLAISDDQLRIAISNDPTFRDSEGQFSRRRFDNFLSAQRMSEAEFLVGLRQNLSRNMLMSTLLHGFYAPDKIAQYALRYQNQYRRAERIEIVASPLIQIAPPTEATLRDFYTTRQELFREGEKRVVSMLTISLEELASNIEISPEQIESYYQENREQFISPESRNIERILFSSEDDARQAWGRLQQGSNFYAIANSYANLDAETVKIDDVTLENFADQTLAIEAFSLEQGAISAPIQGLFGWMILRVTQITPEFVPPLDDLADLLREELQREQAANVLFDYVDQIEDMLAGGANINEVADALQMEITQTTLDMQNPLAIQQDELLYSQVNALSEVDQAVLQEDNLGGYRVLALTQVIDSSIPIFAEIRSEVEALWQGEQQRQQAMIQAQDLADMINQGQSWINVAQKHDLVTRITAAVNRDGELLDRDNSAQEFTPENTHIAALFTLEPGVAVALPSAQGAVIMRLHDKREGQRTMETFKPSLQNQLASGAYLALEDSWQQQYPLNINSEVLSQIYAETGAIGY